MSLNNLHFDFTHFVTLYHALSCDTGCIWVSPTLVFNLDELHQELKTTIAEAQLRYQGLADLRRMSSPPFKVGQQAFVKAKFFRSTHPSAKLSDKFLGPFDSIAQSRPRSITLRLPDTIHHI